MIKKLVMATALVFSCFSTSVMAVPSNGGVSFSSVDSDLFTFDTTTDFFDFTTDNGEVDSVSGDFATYLSVGDSASFVDFFYGASFAPGTIWTSGGLEFVLDSILAVAELSSTVAIEGTGTLTFDGVSAEGLWNITANEAGGTYSWSSSTSTSSAVVEPETLGLLGLGIAGIALSRRKKNS